MMNFKESLLTRTRAVTSISNRYETRKEVGRGGVYARPSQSEDVPASLEP